MGRRRQWGDEVNRRLKNTLNGNRPGGSLEMRVLGQLKANVLMHFWGAGVHVRQLVL